MIKIIAPVTALAVVALIAGGSFYSVDQGERGVITRGGAVVGTAEPGFGFKAPFLTGVTDVSVQSHAQLYDQVPAYSRDQQPASLQVSVNYRVPADGVVEVYSNYGSIDAMVSRLVDRKVYEQVKNVFGQFNAVTAIQDRQRLNTDIQEAIQKAIHGPVIIESVQLENIDFSDAYEASIEQRMLAEVEVQKVRQNAMKEKVAAEITVTKAQAEADSQLAVARAKAQATKLAGEAEADAIKAKGAALRDNPQLIGLISAERWDGVLPSTMVPGSATPFVNVK
jgi:regulator of protease activity HflC (stomatin/prohibitin superfamily)